MLAGGVVVAVAVRRVWENRLVRAKQFGIVGKTAAIETY